ncbi:MAG: hypothetical protein HY059_13670 [Proteobacteria bacterium]|nr:hypothetical protein [Pseudomonadota bacterium]
MRTVLLSACLASILSAPALAVEPISNAQLDALASAAKQILKCETHVNLHFAYDKPCVNGHAESASALFAAFFAEEPALAENIKIDRRCGWYSAWVRTRGFQYGYEKDCVKGIVDGVAARIAARKQPN